MMLALAAMADAVGALLKERNETVAIAESSTGGLISAALLAAPGASAYFLGGGVIYTQTARRALLGIDLDAHPGMRPSTEAYVRLLATSARAALGATWALGESGAAGPAGNRYGDAPGHSCIAVLGPLDRSITIETGEAEREANMWRFAKAAFDLLAATIRSR
jgi:PncC family amidohydrolase